MNQIIRKEKEGLESSQSQAASHQVEQSVIWHLTFPQTRTKKAHNKEVSEEHSCTSHIFLSFVHRLYILFYFFLLDAFMSSFPFIAFSLFSFT